MGMLCHPCCFQKLLQHVMAGWLTWSGKSGEFPGGTHVIEAAEVIDIGLTGLKDPAGFHIIQGWTDGIAVWKFFMGFPMITAHFGALFPPFTALTDLLVMPCAKVFVQESGILALLIPYFHFRDLVHIRDRLSRARHVGFGVPDDGSAFWHLLCSCSFPDSHHLYLRLRGVVTSGGGRPVLIAASFSGFHIITVRNCDSGIITVWVFICYGGLASGVSHTIVVGPITLWAGGPVVGTLMVRCHG